jgi:PhoPQ-activated pathogenicity-related protein
MTKAGVKALDALESIIPKYTSTPVSGFVIAGESKRGWTTWLVGAVEAIKPSNRVIAILPIVLDALNMRAFFHRQFQFYGAWTFALGDYYAANITQAIDEPEFTELLNIIDPFTYRSRLTMPKFAVNAVGDEFQMPDDQRHWVAEMPGEMNVLMIKNAEHLLSTNLPELLQSVASFVEAVVANVSRPKYMWTIDNVTGAITVTVDSSHLVQDAYGCSRGPPLLLSGSTI